jgi:hypothetical protein
LELAGSHREAADVFRYSCSPPLLGRAAACYAKAADWQDAADTYAEDGQIDAALPCCLKGQLWEHGLLLLDRLEAAQHSQQQLTTPNTSSSSSGGNAAPADISSSPRRLRYVRMCALALHALQQRQLMMHFVQLLPANRQQTFLINRGMVAELAAQVEKQRS